MGNKWVLVILMGLGTPSFADTIVTTYVTKVQEERQSTRWTLTEWLRIKERMKMMDVWLAMFSNPEKDAFKPELNLVYGITRGTMKYQGEATDDQDHAALNGAQARVQLWLTNIFTGSTGVRLLNIDFGLEAGGRQTADYDAETTTVFTKDRGISNRFYTGNFRIFGKNIQDSSLVLKVGQYQSKNSVPFLDTDNSRVLRRGMVAGAELQLYLFRWLGIEGNYLSFGKANAVADERDVTGTYYDYMAYIEVSLVRFLIGYYGEDWQFANDAAKATTKESGLFTGLKLQL